MTLEELIADLIDKIVDILLEDKPNKKELSLAYLKIGIARCCKGGEKSDYEKAIEDFTIAEKLALNDNSVLLYYKSLAYYLIGNYCKAESLCNSLKELENNELQKKLLLAEIQFAQKHQNKESLEQSKKNYSEAIEEFLTKISIDSIKRKKVPLIPPALLQNYKKAKDCLKDGD
jgi:tetratricopeptide (TPR) repeat protein